MSMESSMPDSNAPTYDLEKIYLEGGQWIRMINTILWATGSFFVTLSGGCIGLGLHYPSQMRFFSICSTFAYAFWVYISFLYRDSAAVTRTILMNIETRWNVPDEVSLYRKHGHVGKKWYGVFNVQVATLLALAGFWFILLRSDIKPPVGP